MRHQLEWTARENVPVPAAVVAAGHTARRMLIRLRTMPAEQHGGFSIVATRDMLVVIGPPDDLPWVDGVRYCAPEAAAPALWLPTHVAPALPADLLQTAIGKRLWQQPVLLWNEPEQILPLDQPSNLSTTLLDWLEREIE